MTDLPSDRAYIQSEETDTESPISEQTLQKIGSAINFLNDRYQLSIEEFTSSGTFTPPEGVDTVLLIGCGGGGGGAGQNTATAWRAGNGALLGFKAVSVTPLTNYTVTIGGGGSGVLGAGPANDGGNTTFDSLATFLGGSGGFFEGSSDPDPTVLFRSGSSTGSAKGYRGGGRVISLNEFATNTIAHEIGPESSPFFNSNSNDSYAGGNGPFGAGGAEGASAAANTGGGGGNANANSSGGNGGSGRLLVIY